MPAHVRTPWKNVATVAATQGLKGEVVVNVTSDLPFAMFEGAEVTFVPPVLKGVNTASVISVDEDERGALVRFEGIGSIDDAKVLVGRGVLVSRDDIPEGYLDGDDLSGRAVRDDERGDIGFVADFLRRPANDILVVDGPLGEILIPVIEECILDVPEDVAEPILVHLLPGLVEGEVQEL